MSCACVVIFHSNSPTRLEEVFYVESTLRYRQLWHGGGWNVDGRDGSWPHVVGEVAEDDAIHQRRGNVSRQRDLQTRLNDSSQVLHQLLLMLLFLQFPSVGEAEVCCVRVKGPPSTTPLPRLGGDGGGGGGSGGRRDLGCGCAAPCPYP